MKYIFITLLLPLAAFSVRAEDNDSDGYATADQAVVSAQAQSTDGLNLSDSTKDSFYYGWNYPANYTYGYPYYRSYHSYYPYNYGYGSPYSYGTYYPYVSTGCYGTTQLPQQMPMMDGKTVPMMDAKKAPADEEKAPMMDAKKAPADEEKAPMMDAKKAPADEEKPIADDEDDKKPAAE